jgi:hypothetical protein
LLFPYTVSVNPQTAVVLEGVSAAFMNQKAVEHLNGHFYRKPIEGFFR